MNEPDEPKGGYVALTTFAVLTVIVTLGAAAFGSIADDPMSIRSLIIGFMIAQAFIWCRRDAGRRTLVIRREPPQPDPPAEPKSALPTGTATEQLIERAATVRGVKVGKAGQRRNGRGF